MCRYPVSAQNGVRTLIACVGVLVQRIAGYGAPAYSDSSALKPVHRAVAIEDIGHRLAAGCALPTQRARPVGTHLVGAGLVVDLCEAFRQRKFSIVGRSGIKESDYDVAFLRAIYRIHGQTGVV